MDRTVWIYFTKADLRIVLDVPAWFMPNAPHGGTVKYVIPPSLKAAYEWAFIDENNIGLRPKTPSCMDGPAYSNKRIANNYLRPRLQVTITDEVCVAQWGYLLACFQMDLVQPFKLRDTAKMSEQFTLDNFYMRQLNKQGFAKDYKQYQPKNDS